MQTYFHVDRAKSLSEGCEVHLDKKFSEIFILGIHGLYDSDKAKERALSLFPSGLSSHGIRYLLTHEIVISQQGTGAPLPITHTEPMVETIFEQVRRSEFPSCPSRMQSLFAWETQQEAEAFDAERGGGHRIFKVTHNAALIRDQNLLYLGGAPIGALELAEQYWQGVQGPSYKPEAILPLPITIGERIA